MITRRADKNGYLVYRNSKTDKVARAWLEDLADIADICHTWQSRQGGPCDRLAAGDYAYKNLQCALEELVDVKDLVDAGEIDADVDGDDYIDLATAIEDLTGILRRIDKIA